jgi:hypothetical protein
MKRALAFMAVFVLVIMAVAVALVFKAVAVALVFMAVAVAFFMAKNALITKQKN